MLLGQFGTFSNAQSILPFSPSTLITTNTTDNERHERKVSSLKHQAKISSSEFNFMPYAPPTIGIQYPIFM
jgi:hypothetical protein